MSGLYALVLAAGSGSRFGGGKLMASWRGGALIDGALQAAMAAPVRAVHVVSGADPAVRAHVQAWGLTVVDAADHALGLSASLKAGIASLPSGASGVLVFLGDMPLIPRAVLEPLADALEVGAPAAAPVFKGKLGNPVALSSSLFPQIMALEGDHGARRALRSARGRLVRIPSPDDGILFDVDRPDDLPA